MWTCTWVPGTASVRRYVAPVRGAPRPESGRRLSASRAGSSGHRAAGGRPRRGAATVERRRVGNDVFADRSATAGISSAAAESCRRTARFDPIGPGGWRGCGVSCAVPDGGAGDPAAPERTSVPEPIRDEDRAPPPTSHRRDCRLRRRRVAGDWGRGCRGPTAPGASDSGAGASVEACDADSEVGIVGDMDGGVPGCGARARGRRREPSSGSPAATTAVRMARPEAIATRRPSPAVAGQRHRVARARHRASRSASPATRTATAPARARPGRCRPRAPRADPGSRSCPRELQVGGSAPAASARARRARTSRRPLPAPRHRAAAPGRRGPPAPTAARRDPGPPRRPRRTPGTRSAAWAGPRPTPARTRRPAPATARPTALPARVRRRPARSRSARTRTARGSGCPDAARRSRVVGVRTASGDPAARLATALSAGPPAASTASPTGTSTSISAPHSGQCNTHCSCPPIPRRQSAASRPRSPSGRSTAPGCSHSPAAWSTAAPRASGGATAPASHAASRRAGSAEGGAASPAHGVPLRLAHGVPPWCPWFARRGSLTARRTTVPWARRRRSRAPSPRSPA